MGNRFRVRIRLGKEEIPKAHSVEALLEKAIRKGIKESFSRRHVVWVDENNSFVVRDSVRNGTTWTDKIAVANNRKVVRDFIRRWRRGKPSRAKSFIFSFTRIP